MKRDLPPSLLARLPKDPIAEAAKTPYDGEDIDLPDLLDKSKEILRREVQNLLALSLKGKLDSRNAECLVSYTKLLSTMVKEEKDRFSKMSKEELEALASQK